MFPSGYFPTGYFPTGYFPPIIVAVGVVPVWIYSTEDILFYDEE